MLSLGFVVVLVAVTGAERGYRLLTETPLLPPDFSEEVFQEVWRSWPEPLREEAERATPERRREMAFQRYGLTARPGEATDGPRETSDGQGEAAGEGGEAGIGPSEGRVKPLQYVVDDAGNWTMNCFACHGGSVAGEPTPGAPNNRFDLQTMTEEIRRTKLRMGKPLSRMDLGSLVIPLGTTVGTTNAVVFGQGLMHYRDEKLNLVDRLPVSFDHHDMDAPPWWHFSKRSHIYIDGFAEKGHRGLMQFMLVPENGPEFFRLREDDFRDVFAYLSSLRPPEYPGEIDDALAESGRVVFNESCAECHGTYGPGGRYPNRRVALDEIGTDPVRLRALVPAGRQKYADSWFAHGGEPDEQATVIEPDGYVAPPLDGVWASPPYFHNGSVPTLWHVLNPDRRPTVWHRIDDSLDHERIGLRVEEVERVAWDDPDVSVRRRYFDTRRYGKGNGGHEFPAALDDSERRAVLEYLKTL